VTEPLEGKEVDQLLRATFEEYAERRVAYYSDSSLLRKLLDRNVLLYAMRGVTSAREFVELALTAHETASEETMIGNAWQSAIARLSPHTVGGGDLRTERDGELWIVQLKMSPKQNAGAKAQDLRLLRNKLLTERDHHPGRKSVKAMMGFLTGKPRSQWVTNTNKSTANSDIYGFQYQVMVGRPFLEWVGAEYDPGLMLRSLNSVPARVRAARNMAIERLNAELRDRLEARSLDTSVESVVALQQQPFRDRQR
jgi:hypothetical protein